MWDITMQTMAHLTIWVLKWACSCVCTKTVWLFLHVCHFCVNNICCSNSWIHQTEPCCAENTFKTSTHFQLLYTSADQTTSTRQHSTSGKISWLCNFIYSFNFFIHKKRRDSMFAWLAQPDYFFPFCSTGGLLLVPGRLGQFLGRLRLLLGYLLLRHDGHPWWHRPSDGLLGHVVVVNEGKETSTAPRPLRGVVSVQPSWQAATLLLQINSKTWDEWNEKLHKRRTLKKVFFKESKSWKIKIYQSNILITCVNTLMANKMLWSIYHINKAVRTRLLVLVDLVDDQKHHTDQESQGTDHQQGHLQGTEWPGLVFFTAFFCPITDF